MAPARRRRHARGARGRETKDQTLAHLYYTPGSPGSFGGGLALWRTVKSKGYHEGPQQIAYKDVQDFLMKQRTYTLFKPRRNKYPKNRALPIPGANHLLAVDIWDLRRFTNLIKKRRGKVLNYALVGIDGFSKRISAVPMLDKTQESVLAALKQVEKPPASFRFRVLFTDQDRSFQSKKVQDWLHEKRRIHVCSRTDLHCYPAERAILTLSRRLRRLLYYNRRFDWVSPLAEVVCGYNLTPHTQLVDGKYAPSQVTVFNTPEIYDYMYHGGGVGRSRREARKAPAKLAVGDTVLIAMPKQLFQKGSEPTFQTEYFTVATVTMPTRPGQTRPIYTLQDDNGRSIQGRFYQEQLQKVTRRGARQQWGHHRAGQQ